MTIENKDILGKDLKSPQNQADMGGLKESLQTWWDKKETTQEATAEAKKIIEQIVAGNLSPAEMEWMLNKLPIDKRMQAERLIIESQRELIATMSQEKYKQYLQAQFPTGMPANASEMALSMVTDTSEMYKNAQREIAITGIEEHASDHAKEMLRNEQRIAITATQEAEGQARWLANQLADTSQSRV